MSMLRFFRISSTARTETELQVVRGAFDDAFYLARYPDVSESGADPAEHYCRFGWREGRDPAPGFSTAQYIADNPDVAAAGLNPFWHYLTIGQHEGRSTAPAQQDPRILHEIAVIGPAFDSAWYLARYPDVAQSGADPAEHYCRFGWQEGRDPAPGFSTAHYIAGNPDVAAAGLNPFWHYVVAGQAEGRSPAPVPAPEPPRICHEIETIRAEFDAAFYRRGVPDLPPPDLPPDADPVAHYCQTGWQQGRDPVPGFSTAYYLDSNPDVAAAGVNPFWHYVVAGRAEGRMACHPGGHRAAALLALRPLEDTVSAWRRQMPALDPAPDPVLADPAAQDTDAPLDGLLGGVQIGPRGMLSAGDLIRLILDGGHRVTDRLMISVSHDNYRAVSGGVQYCVQREERLSAGHGFAYLNLHPCQPLPRLAHLDEDPDPALVLMLGGQRIGTARSGTVAAALRGLAGRLKAIEVVIHQLMGHAPERIAALVQATGRRDCRLWLHDFFTLCPSYVLQRNGLDFCGAPGPASNACRLCVYGEERIAHLDRMRRFFDALDVHVIAPSAFMAETWTARSDLRVAGVSVQPHMTVRWKAAPPRRRPPRARAGSASDAGTGNACMDKAGMDKVGLDKAGMGPVTIAFVGFPAPHKGWPVFETLVARQAGSDPACDFVYFGMSPVNLGRVAAVPVHVTEDDPDAMIRAIAARGVDLVLHWASCAETFSFSTFEALAAGAWVLTNPGSGNVAATVRATGRGAVLQDEADLAAFFHDGRLAAMVADLRARRQGQVATLTRSKMVFATLDQGVHAL